MRYLSIVEVLELHVSIISSSGGARGIRDIGALESAVNQPRVTFDRTDLYPDVDDYFWFKLRITMKIRDVIKLIEEDGWYRVSQKSSHRQYKHPVKRGPVTIAGHLGDHLGPILLPVFLGKPNY